MTGVPTLHARPRRAFAGVATLAVILSAAPLQAQSLNGSRASLDVQNRVAEEHDFTFLRTASQVKRFVSGGYLVPIRENRDYYLHAVSFPYARPEVGIFVQRLAAQYHRACGEQLVVTSLTRPINLQPRNASQRSVHPTGMAVDLRRSSVRACRSWLEDTLLDLEKVGVVEATRERYPPHYHVVVFPRPYDAYVTRMAAREADEAKATVAATPTVRMASATVSGPAPSTVAYDAPPAASVEDLVAYEVRRGDSLWGIARKYDTTVDRLRAENGLDSNRIYAGQVLDVPVSR